MKTARQKNCATDTDDKHSSEAARTKIVILFCFFFLLDVVCTPLLALPNGAVGCFFLACTTCMLGADSFRMNLLPFD